MAVYFCPHCKTRSNFDRRFSEGHRGAQFEAHVCQNCDGCVFVFGTEIVYPVVRTDAAPALPDPVREDFGEALRSLNGGNAKSAVIMTRSALQVATREQGAKGNSL